jgi:hypothetical protein
MSLQSRLSVAVAAFATLAALAPGASPAAPAPQRPVEILAAFGQQGCPVSITLARSTGEYLFQDVGLRNPSPNAVTSVTFGVVLRVLGNSTAKPVYFRTLTIPTSMKPGDSRDVGVYAMTWAAVRDSLAQVPGPEIAAEIGVTKVEFANAPPYEYHFEAEGGFRTASSRSVPRREPRVMAALNAVTAERCVRPYAPE